MCLCLVPSPFRVAWGVVLGLAQGWFGAAELL